MRIALAQMNSRLGEFSYNRKKIVQMLKQAQVLGCDLVVFPEAALFGYHPMDLLERPSVVRDQLKELDKLIEQIPEGVGALVGAITETGAKWGKPYHNSAVLLEKGRKLKTFAKQLLPTYDVFDEGRHIEPGETAKNFFRYKNKNILVTICEDIWAWPLSSTPLYSRYGINPLAEIKNKKVDLVLNLSASPYTDTKYRNRLEVTRRTASHFKAPMVYVNMVGAQDELIFDGGSFAIDKKGRLLCESHRFVEDLTWLDLKTSEGVGHSHPNNLQELRRQALVLGLRDFANKTGFSRAHLGLSGGIDSALVACLAVDALGAENVTCLALPGPFSSALSLKMAQQLSKNLGVELLEVDIDSMYNSVLSGIEKGLDHSGFNLVNENLQARLRAIVLMAYANKHHSLLLGTSNKSELAMGYSTLYGDLSGGLLPIGDLLKTEVYALSHHMNVEKIRIPKPIIARPPSAELRPGQKDTDSLPPYEQLDVVVEHLVEDQASARSVLQKRVLKSLMQSEFKRWQSPPILKVSDHAFGRGRRFPVAHGAYI